MTNAHHNDEPPRSWGWRCRNPRRKHLNASGWIKVISSLMDSGTAKSAAHIGRECVAHRSSSRPLLVVWQSTTEAHFGGASAFYFHCQSRRVGISGFHCGGELCCLATGAQHDVTMGAYRGRKRSTPGATCVIGKELAAPHADASFPAATWTTASRTVDGDGDGGHPHARQRTHLQTTITSPCG